MNIVFPPLSDPVGEALHCLRMTGMFYCHSEFAAPWSLVLPPMNRCLMLHVVTSGECWLEVEGSPDHLLQPGALALVPHGEGHRMASQPSMAGTELFSSARQQVSERYEILQLGGGGRRPGWRFIAAAGLAVRSGLQPRFQTPHGRLAGRGAA